MSGTLRQTVVRGAAFLALAGCPAEALAEEKPLAVGIRSGVDVAAASEYRNEPDTSSVELFLGWSFNPSLSAEASVGYRHTSFSQAQGVSPSSFSLTQVPILAGAAWTFWPKGPVSVRLGAGVAILPSRTASTTAGPSRNVTVETSTTIVGGYAGLATQVALFDNLFVDVTFRFVLDPVPPESGRPATQNYFSALVGFSSRF